MSHRKKREWFKFRKRRDLPSGLKKIWLKEFPLEISNANISIDVTDSYINSLIEFDLIVIL